MGYQAICLPIINPYHTLVLYPLSRGAFLYIPFVFLLWRFWSKNLWRLSVIGLERTIYITGRYVIEPSLLTLLLFHIEIVLVTHSGTVPTVTHFWSCILILSAKGLELFRILVLSSWTFFSVALVVPLVLLFILAAWCLYSSWSLVLEATWHSCASQRRSRCCSGELGCTLHLAS